jgi:hypothetical protein
LDLKLFALPTLASMRTWESEDDKGVETPVARETLERTSSQVAARMAGSREFDPED